MADDTPRRGLPPVSVPTPDDVVVSTPDAAADALLPRRSSEVWEFQGPDEAAADEPRRSSATDDVDADEHSGDVVAAPARVVIPPIPAQPAGAATLGKFASSPASAEIIAVARRSATSPTPWTEVKPRRSATSPSEWEQWADSPVSPPSYAELQRAALSKDSLAPATVAETPSPAAPVITPIADEKNPLPDWVWYAMSVLVLVICAVLLILAL
ncbi:MAG: hypothetical protein ACRCWS_09310 [Propionibacteriaceae bacterium]